jgi:hypothetical protein
MQTPFAMGWWDLAFLDAPMTVCVADAFVSTTNAMRIGNQSLPDAMAA